jgi:transposase
MQCMDRTSLEKLLGEGLSLAEIGRRFDRHESTVAYWVARHGLEANGRARHAARGGLAFDQLSTLVAAGLSTRQIAARLGHSQGSVRYWLRKHDLRTRRSSESRKRRPRQSYGVAQATRTTLACPRHGDAEHYFDRRGYSRCCRCRQEAVVRRRRRVKDLLVREAGGRCRLCGYDSSTSALQFHHLDPRDKLFGVAQGGMGRSLDRLREEARKCVLLCSNCHAEVEAGVSSVSGVVQVDDPG